MCTCLVNALVQGEIREAEVTRLLLERNELREQLSESRARNREMTSVMSDLQLCLNDLQSKVTDLLRVAKFSGLNTFGSQDHRT